MLLESTSKVQYASGVVCNVSSVVNTVMVYAPVGAIGEVTV
jgi:hypothetical protein